MADSSKMKSKILTILYEKYKEHVRQLKTLSIYPTDAARQTDFDETRLLEESDFQQSDKSNIFSHIESLELVGFPELKWNHLLPVFELMPNLKELNLQENISLFDGFDCKSIFSGLQNIEKLIITSTNGDFCILKCLLPLLPNLKILYMSGNKLNAFDTVPLDQIDSVGKPSILTELYLSRNDFTSLLDITPIGNNLFPELKMLSLSECPNLTDFDKNTNELNNFN